MVDDADFVSVPGSDRDPIDEAEPLERVASEEPIAVTLRLRRRSNAVTGRPDLAPSRDREVRARQRDDYAQCLGADPADVEKVRRFADQRGLEVSHVDLLQRSAELSGPARRMEEAFRLELTRYRLGNMEYRGRIGPVHVPRYLAGVVEGVFGLDDRPQARTDTGHPTLLDAALLDPSADPVVGAVARPMWPNQIAALYNFPHEADGDGEIIAIIALAGGYVEADFEAYFSRIRADKVPSVVSVGVDGATNSPTGGGEDGEVYLDVEVAGAVAPGAEITVYFAPNTARGFIDAVSAAIFNGERSPSVVCISWGFPEQCWTGQAIKAFQELFEDAAALHVTVLASVGDHGAGDAAGDGAVHARFPASSPWVLACGGTRIGTITQPLHEETWNDHDGWATGGGVSALFDVPSWQAQVADPTSIAANRRRGRGVPDIAGLAAQSCGYIVMGHGVYAALSGTSAVTPLYGGLVARLNDALDRPVGHLAPLLYAISKRDGERVFRDVTQGNNSVPSTASWGPAVEGYAAGVGWDPCTGLGSVDGTELCRAVAAMLNS